MDSLTRLQIINLFKKYDYFLTEFQFKNEISIVSQSLFQQNVQKILNEFKKNEAEENIQSINENFNFNTKNEETNIDTESIVTDPTLKNLYRKIVKQTHPDKIKNSYLNKLYIDATDAIEKNNALSIYRICVLLDISFEVSIDIAEKLDKEIADLQQKISFLESSYHMKWHNSPKSEKNDILVNYLIKSLKLFEA